MDEKDQEFDSIARRYTKTYFLGLLTMLLVWGIVLVVIDVSLHLLKGTL